MQSVLLAYLRWISWCSLSLAPLLTDIDECKTTENVCGGHACLNMLGSYRCECEAGYMFNSITRLCEGKLFLFFFFLLLCVLMLVAKSKCILSM